MMWHCKKIKKSKLLSGGHGAPLMPAVESSIEYSEPGTIMLNIGGLGTTEQFFWAMLIFGLSYF